MLIFWSSQTEIALWITPGGNGIIAAWKQMSADKISGLGLKANWQLSGYDCVHVTKLNVCVHSTNKISFQFVELSEVYSAY